MSKPETDRWGRKITWKREERRPGGWIDAISGAIEGLDGLVLTEDGNVYSTFPTALRDGDFDPRIPVNADGAYFLTSDKADRKNMAVEYLKRLLPDGVEFDGSERLGRFMPIGRVTVEDQTVRFIAYDQAAMRFSDPYGGDDEA